MQPFVDEHRALIARVARSHTTERGEKIAAEDVAREMELVVLQLGTLRSLVPSQITQPETFLRALVKHAVGRARRRRTLIEQLAAGDDLDALSAELSALDADLSLVPDPALCGSSDARDALDRVKSRLSPRDALIFTLLYEDEGTYDDVIAALGTTGDVVEAAAARALELAASEITVPPDARGRARDGGEG